MPVTRQAAAGLARPSAGSAMEAEPGGARATLQRTAGNLALQHLMRGPSTRPDSQASIESELAGQGEPLDEVLRAQMEHAAGSRLGDVRIHRDAHAARAAKAVNARAFTVGNHIVFGPGAFLPDSTAGKRLLAHELGHVLHRPGAASLALVPPGSRAEQQSSEGKFGANAPAAAATTGGMARAVEKNLTNLSDAELWAEYDLARKSVASKPHGPDYDAAVAYVREIEDSVRARAAPATAAPQGPEELNFSKANPEVAGAEQAPFGPDTPLNEGDIAPYSYFNRPAHVGDELAGHEILPHASLKATGRATTRGSTPASAGNPSLAVGGPLHKRLNAEQGQLLPMRKPAELAKMPDEPVIEKNITALERAEVEHSQGVVARREALRHAAEHPPAAPPTGEPANFTPAAPQQNFTPANPEQVSSAPAAQNFTPGPKPAATPLPPQENLTPATPPPALEKPPAPVEVNPGATAPKANLAGPPVPEVVEPVAPPPVAPAAEGVAASEAGAAVRPPLGSPKLGAAAGAAGVALNVLGIAMMARDMKIEQSGYIGRVGQAILEDEHGEYTIQPTGGFLYGHGKKTYISGDRKGQTVDLGFWDMRREYQKRDEKYGYIDWKGDLIPGRVPPVYVPRPGLDTA